MSGVAVALEGFLLNASCMSATLHGIDFKASVSCIRQAGFVQ